MMARCGRPPSPVLWLVVVWVGLATGGSQSALAEQLFQLRNGLVIRGDKAEIATLKEGFGAAGAGNAAVRPIWLIDDGLRRTYVHGRGMVTGPPIDVGNLEQDIQIWHPEPLGGRAVAGLGNLLGVSEFNEMGRRILTVRGPEGPLEVIQGISEINSRYANLMALKPPAGSASLSWNMRVATRSIDTATLDKIFARRLDQTDLDARLQVVRLYIAAERYGAAKTALTEIIEDFPAEADLQSQLTALTEQQAAQLLAEAELRAAAGQFQLARDILSRFPVDAVGRVTRIQVQDALARWDGDAEQARRLIAQLQQQVALLPPDLRTRVAPLIDEIVRELSATTLTRLSDYARLGNSEEIPLEGRVALAVSGWLLGSGAAERNLTVAISLIEVRRLVAAYLASSDSAERQQLLDQLRNLEGATAEYIDRLLPLMTPPLPWPEGSSHETIEGLYSVDTGAGQYVIQLPPEYNPLREYPCVLTLHESRSNPIGQIDWWSGVYDSEAQTRLGQGTRQGFIVVAPQWSRPRQRTYEYTAAEHARVLSALRDALRRAAIDSDRVFIAGHGEGATAAWDIALAHPDLWAGLISISGAPAKTVYHYKPNSRYLPIYLVMGELDQNKAAGGILDEYMSFDHDAMVVMYRGRGREYFYEEAPRLFDWMQLSSHRRNPLPREFEVATMRRSDNFFWWLELGELNPEVAIDPLLWEQAERQRAGVVSCNIAGGNLVTLGGPSDSFRLCLRPHEAIDLTQEIKIRFGTRTIRTTFDGSLDHLLEDVRRRADRKRAFWMSVGVP